LRTRKKIITAHQAHWNNSSIDNNKRVSFLFFSIPSTHKNNKTRVCGRNDPNSLRLSSIFTGRLQKCRQLFLHMSPCSFYIFPENLPNKFFTCIPSNVLFWIFRCQRAVRAFAAEGSNRLDGQLVDRSEPSYGPQKSKVPVAEVKVRTSKWSGVLSGEHRPPTDQPTGWQSYFIIFNFVSSGSTMTTLCNHSCCWMRPNHNAYTMIYTWLFIILLILLILSIFFFRNKHYCRGCG
jgi:hypothetical protein